MEFFLTQIKFTYLKKKNKQTNKQRNLFKDKGHSLWTNEGQSLDMICSCTK